MEWPRPLFDLFYDAFWRRERVEQLERRRDLMISALYANSAFYKTDQGPSAREEMSQNIYEHTEDMISKVYGGETRDEIEERLVKSDPFYNEALQVENLPIGVEQKAELEEGSG